MPEPGESGFEIPDQPPPPDSIEGLSELASAVSADTTRRIRAEVHEETAKESNFLVMLIGVAGIIVAWFVPIGGIVLGLAAIATALFRKREGGNLSAWTGLITGAIAIAFGVILYLMQPAAR